MDAKQSAEKREKLIPKYAGVSSAVGFLCLLLNLSDRV